MAIHHWDPESRMFKNMNTHFSRPNCINFHHQFTPANSTQIVCFFFYCSLNLNKIKKKLFCYNLNKAQTFIYTFSQSENNFSRHQTQQRHGYTEKCTEQKRKAKKKNLSYVPRFSFYISSIYVFFSDSFSFFLFCIFQFSKEWKFFTINKIKLNIRKTWKTRWYIYFAFKIVHPTFSAALAYFVEEEEIKRTEKTVFPLTSSTLEFRFLVILVFLLFWNIKKVYKFKTDFLYICCCWWTK